MSHVDLDDTSGCSAPCCCECCGTHGGLVVCTAESPMGVLCAGLCPTCVERGRLPWQSLSQAVGRVLGHCEHLGIDLEQAAALRAAEHKGDATAVEGGGPRWVR